MTVTASLLRLFRVDQQLRGLQTRLHAADRFLAEQERQFKELDVKHSALVTQLRQIKAAQGGYEGEVATVDARVATLREQMNAARTNKEYSAFLTELNTLKAQKEALEKDQIDSMEKIEALGKQIESATSQRGERTKMVEKARSDRSTKEAEIKDRVAELRTQRAALAKEVPADVLAILEDLIARRGDEAMAHVEVLDRRNHEWTCGACMMALPVQHINAIAAGKFTRCSNCQCILFTEEDVVSKKIKKETAEA